MCSKFIFCCFFISSFFGFGISSGNPQIAWITLFSRENSPDFLRRLSFENVSQQCSDHTQAFQKKLTENPITGLNDGFWELKMLDAWGKIPEGFLGGNTRFIGSYSSCLDVNVQPHQHNETDIMGFQGRYIPLMIGPKPLFRRQERIDPALAWKIPKLEKKALEKAASGDALGGLTVTLGLCLPSTCSEEEIISAVQSIFDNSKPTSGLGLVVSTLGSNSKADEWNLDGLDILMIVIIAVIGVMVIAGTLLEIAMLYKITNYKSNLGKLLLGFSAYRNTKILFATSDKKSPGRSEILHCLNGIRFISMTWVLLSHVIGNFQIAPLNNFLFYFSKITSSYAFQGVINGFPSVDTFFLLSGCLVAYLTFKELDKTKGRINWIMFYVHRYLRLTGVYAFLVLFHMTLFRGFKGGAADYVPILVDSCRVNWWKNMLYITNYFEDKITCIGQTWYLDNDMQMFLVAPLIIYPIWRLKKLGLLMASIWVLASAAVPYALTIKNDWPATSAFDFEGKTDYFQHNYIVPWCRFSPYVCGILLGYALHLTKGKSFKMAKELNIFCWILAFVIGYLVIYGLNLPDVFANNPPPKAALDIYGGFHRLAWGVAVSWVIFACSRGYGGWINTFLSWEAFEPLAKLSYNIYLVHISVDLVLVARMTFTASISDIMVVMRILNTLVFSIFVSIILFVGVEVPWANTEKWIFSMILPKSKKT